MEEERARASWSSLILCWLKSFCKSCLGHLCWSSCPLFKDSLLGLSSTRKNILIILAFLNNKYSFLCNTNEGLLHNNKTKQVWRTEAWFYAICSTKMRLAFTFWGQWESSHGSHCTKLHKATVSSILVLINLYFWVLGSLCHTGFYIHM